ncbi:MAG: TIGR02677 family protein [Myxococcales bacterium]
MRSLQRTIDLQGASVEAFVAYKERLIEYLERFIGEMVVSGSEIASAIERLDALGADRLLQAAAERELADALEVTPESRSQSLEGWRGRWNGLRAWFVDQGDAPSQAEVLRARARSAIPALISAVANLHDRRLTRADRSTDWRTLARWFAELESEDQAHRLWRAATGLPPARHLTIDDSSRERWELDDVGPQTSWLEAPPLRISLRLRATGRYTRRGRVNDVVDKSQEKAELARLARLETEQLERALRRLATGTTTRLSQIGELDPTEFGLLLDLLGEALSARTREDAPVETTSSDGGLLIRLEPLLEEPDARATIEVTGLGRLSGPDCQVTIRRLSSRAATEDAA